MQLGLRLGLTAGGGAGPDTIPPSVTVDAVSDTQIDYTSSEAGTAYWLVNGSSATLSGATIAAGGGDASGSFSAPSGTTNQAISLAGVATGSYYLHFTIKDAAGNYSDDVPTAFTHTAADLELLGDGYVGSTGAAATHSFSNSVRVGNTALPATFPAGKVAVLAFSTSTITACTIDGNAATEQGSSASGNMAYGFEADIAGGGTGNIQITVSPSTANVAIAAWLIPPGMTLQQILTASSHANPTNIVMDVNTSAGQCAIAGRFSNNTTPPVSTWTGLTGVVPDVAVPTTTPARSFSAAHTLSVAGGTPEQFRCALNATFISAKGIIMVYG